MPNRDWSAYRKAARSGLIVAGLLAVAIGVGLWATGESKPSNSQTESKTDCQYAYDHGGPKGRVPVPTGLKCTEEPRQSHEDDAYAQRDFRKPTTVVAAFQHWLHKLLADPVSFLTLVLAASTIGMWLSTRRLWQGADAQAAEFKKSIEHADVSGRIQLRPYLFIESMEWHWFSDPKNSSVIIEWQLTLLWRNFGRTPAKRVKTCINKAAFRGAMPDGFDFPDRPHGPTNSSDVAPHGTFVTRYRFPIRHMRAAWRGRFPLYYWTWAEYDGFREDGRHRTERCAQVIQNADPDIQQPALIVDVFAPRFNGSDETCYRKPASGQNT